MLVSIHQPHYLPWLRYLDKIARSDVFILLDDVQYEKNGFQNRNKIKTAQGWSYLTVPVLKPTQVPIREIRPDNSAGWALRHARSLEMSYGKAPHFAPLWAELREFYQQDWEHLADLCAEMLTVFLRHLKLNVPVVRSSTIPTVGSSTQRLAELCLAVGGDTYLSGRYAVESYLDPEVLKSAGVALAFQEWQAPVYPQLYPQAGFIPDLSIVDLLGNTGDAAPEILRAAGAVGFPG